MSHTCELLSFWSFQLLFPLATCWRPLAIRLVDLLHLTMPRVGVLGCLSTRLLFSTFRSYSSMIQRARLSQLVWLPQALLDYSITCFGPLPWNIRCLHLPSILFHFFSLLLFWFIFIGPWSIVCYLLRPSLSITPLLTFIYFSFTIYLFY